MFKNLLLLAILLGLWGCNGQADRLYALKLDREPTEEDWSLAVPVALDAQGGATTIQGESDVDGDSVHKATASCHHGTGAPKVRLELKAFYTQSRLYLRAKWGDPTANLGPVWRWQGGKWRAEQPIRDGMGLLWGGDSSQFTCVRTCHLNDWRMAGDKGMADYSMRSPDHRDLDFWIWRAGRGEVEGTFEDASLTQKGKAGDTEGEFEVQNSQRSRDKRDGVFAEGDSPLRAPKPDPDALAPGMLVVNKNKDSNEVEGRGVHYDGAWTVTVSRSLSPLGKNDVAFAPGGEYSFGVALLDAVAKDHNAVSDPVRILLVDPAKIKKGNE